MIKKLIGCLAIASYVGMMLLIAFSRGEMNVKEHTQVVVFDMTNGGYGPWFGKCQQLDKTHIACATQTK